MKNYIFIVSFACIGSYSINLYALDFLNQFIFTENSISENKLEEKIINSYSIELKKYSGLFMCPYLKPKMHEELNKINASNFKGDSENYILYFESDLLLNEEKISEIFIQIIGISSHSILNIKINK